MKGGKLLINEEVNRQVIAIVKSGNIKSAKMVIDLMSKFIKLKIENKSLREENKKLREVNEIFYNKYKSDL